MHARVRGAGGPARGVLPLAPRIALRDTSRNRTAAAPAISAVMAAVVVLVPVVAMLGAGLLTRSRLPIERRL